MIFDGYGKHDNRKKCTHVQSCKCVIISNKLQVLVILVFYTKTDVRADHVNITQRLLGHLSVLMVGPVSARNNNKVTRSHGVLFHFFYTNYNTNGLCVCVLCVRECVRVTYAPLVIFKTLLTGQCAVTYIHTHILIRNYADRRISSP